jgi:multidrug efflux pump subunit AcrA (membrane-fusion protein)
MAKARLHSPNDARDSIESLIGAHGPQRPVMYWMLLILGISSIASLPLVTVDMSVGAPGQIRPALERLPVYAAIGGRIEQLLVVENQRVEEGETMLVIESTALDTRISQNRVERDENSRALVDLESLLAPGAWASLLGDFSSDSLAPQTDLIQSLATGTGPIVSPRYFRQHNLLQSDLRRLLSQRTKAESQNRRAESLHHRGLISDEDFEERNFAIQTANQEISLVIQQALSGWQSDRMERELKKAALGSESAQLQQQRELHQVRAPIAGVTLGFNGLQPGLYLPADQRLGEISPHGPLLADVYISPRDVGFIRPDQIVKLQVDAFPYTEWGMLVGRVHSISSDVIVVGQQHLFKAVVDLDEAKLRSSSGTEVSIRRGMTVQARFVLQQRTLFSMLFGKMSESLDPRTLSRQTISTPPHSL